VNVMLKSPSLCDADGQGGRSNGWLWSFAAPRIHFGWRDAATWSARPML
jgi:hypothetical protein